MINLGNILLRDDGVHAISANNGKIIRTIPVIDRVIGIDVAPMITTLSTDSDIVFRV